MSRTTLLPRVSQKPGRFPLPLPGDLDGDAMDGPDPRPLIDRRHLPRVACPAQAFLAPADDTGAVRPPVIRTRDLNPRGVGFRARQDLSVLGEAVLRLPTSTGRLIAVACRVRRSLEMGNGWFDGRVEFVKPQPDLTVCDGQWRLNSGRANVR